MNRLQNNLSSDARLVEVLDAYLAAIEAGTAPSREALLAEHPELASELQACLASLEFIQQAAVKPSSADVSSLSALPGDAATGVLGDFRIVREIGRGGMGIVYEAEQISLGRRVALKVLPFAGTVDARRLRRFKNEAQAAAHLQHQHIVPVYFVGQERGVHYYAMQFVEGRTLASLIAEARPPKDGTIAREPPAPGAAGFDATTDYTPANGAAGTIEARGVNSDTHAQTRSSVLPAGSLTEFRKVAQWGEQAAEALEHAHQMGVVHRDIKPANLIVDDWDHLWITDFGLAQFQSGTNLTLTGDLVGTLRYMSPEQALAKRVPIDHRTDVYSLGVTLYELFTLEPAFTGQDRQEVLRQIAFEEPTPPRRRNKGVPAELETIVLKAMAKAPDERYATAQELADDLRHWQEDRPIRARRPSLILRLRRWGRRHRPLVAAAAAAVLGAVIMLATSIGWLAHERAARRARTAEVIGKALEESANSQAQRRLPEALSAARRANNLLAEADVEAELAHRAQTRLADLELLDRLEQIRLTQATAMKDGHFDWAAQDRSYEQEFQKVGFNIQALPPEAIARRIRATSVAVELAALLDDWAVTRRYGRGVRELSWKTLLEVACLTDPDAWRVQARRALVAGDVPKLHVLMTAADVAGVRPATLASIARALRGNHDHSPAAESFLRAAQRRYPGDFWLNYELFEFYALRASAPRPKEAVPFAVAVVALQPQNAGARLNLGTVLDSAGQVDDAIAEYREAIRLKKDYAEAHNNLGWAFKERGLLDEAIAEYREAIRLKADLALTHRNLGVALQAKGRLDGAIAEYRKAIRFDMGDADAHNDLGTALRDNASLDDAIAEFRAAIRLKRECAEFHDNLGMAFADKGRLDDAIAEHREAIRIKKNLPEAHFNLGNALHHKGQLKEAIGEYRLAIRLKKDYADAHVNLGNVLQEQGRVDEAIAECREAIRLEKDSPTAHNDLGNALRAKGQLANAEAEYREAIRLKNDLAAAHRNLGLVFQDKGLTDKAIAEFRKAVRYKRDFAEAHANLGAALLDKRQWDKAIAECREAIRYKMDFPEPHLNLGAALYQKGRVDEAIAECREAIRFKNNYAEAHNNLGLALRRKGEIDKAIPEFREATRLKDDYADAHNNLGVLLERKGRLDEAIREYRHAIRLKKDFVEAHSNLGVALALKGQSDEAIAEFRVGIAFQKDDAELHNNLGSALLRKGQLEQAVAEYQEAIRLRRDYPGAHRNLGTAFYKKGQLDEAIAEFRQAIRLKKDFAEAHHGLAVALKAKGRLDEAIAEYHKATLLRKDYAEAHCNLGRALTEKGCIDEAIAEYRKAICLNKGYTDAHFNLASALASEGRLDEAVAELRQAIRLKNEFAEAHCNLAQILTAQGRFHQALEEYRRGHELGSRIPGWPYPSAEWLRRAEILARLDERLADFLAGRIAPNDTAEQLDLAWLCQQPFKSLYAASARWYRQAFTAQPKLADGLNAAYRYNAACAAALAGCGKGKDAGNLSAAERARLRQQALTWLRADLQAYRLVIDKSAHKAGPAVAQRLQGWLVESNLAGVRNPQALAQVSGQERHDWQAFWQEVKALQQGAAKPPAAANAAPR